MFHITMQRFVPFSFWIHMDVLDGEMFSFFQKSKFGNINTMCCIKLFAETFGVMAKLQSKYNMIISKSKTLLELKTLTSCRL
jgi:hypothetical protein